MHSQIKCLHCGFPSSQLDEAGICPLCKGEWETWEVRWPSLPLMHTRDQVAAWLSHLPQPVALDLFAIGGDGLHMCLHVPRGRATGVIQSWASMTHQQSIFVKSEQPNDINHVRVCCLRTRSIVPNLVIAETKSDPILAIGGQLLTGLPDGGKAGLRLWVTGHNLRLQNKIRVLSSYSYGTTGGVKDEAPNPWNIKLSLLRVVIMAGAAMIAISISLAIIHLINPLAASVAGSAGLMIFLAGCLGLADWLHWRSIPKNILEARVKDTLLSTAIVYYGPETQQLNTLISGQSQWAPMPVEWPNVLANAIPLPSLELAALIAPPEIGEGGGILSRAAILDVPTAFPSRAMINASFKIGSSVNTGESVGIDPDGHAVVMGGTRSGKSSFVYDMLRQLTQRGKDAPGIFMVDPHLSLCDAFLQDIDELEGDLRKMAVQRLRIVTPDQPEVVPLNLLALAEYSWAGNAIVQIGRRIWDDYWGPRMQAALLGLFRLAHIWNRNNPDKTMGLIHVVFSAFNSDWRHKAMGYLSPVDRLGSLGLDALLGQYAGGNGKWEKSWVTEVISPVLSKVMALELSPWLFTAMHQKSFANIDQWVRERAWIILRLPAGQMGREAARLTAGVIYNVFDAIYHKVALESPAPFYFIVDEAQEIGSGMRLEAMLSEGAKFGARMFVLTQSLSMMREIEGLEPVVQALLANTSTQAFFSPDPQDAELIRETLNSTARFGTTTLDLKSLQCWLRVRLNGEWQPPAMIQVNPLRSFDRDRVQSLIREVIALHPEDYVLPATWEQNAVDALNEMIPLSQRHLLSLTLSSDMDHRTGESTLDHEQAQTVSDDGRPVMDRIRNNL